MGAALASADLAISRAGASTLGEYPYFGLPAILVPYPHAWRYQKVNAKYLENKGASVILADKDLQTRLLPVINEITSQPERLKAMGQAMRQLQPRPPAAECIADLARQIGRQGSPKQALITNKPNSEVR
jgi:UDP-N-acetylglucosamine:LPS N-acetylglucosamine transferase